MFFTMEVLWSGHSNGMAAGLLASVTPNSMSDMVESERSFLTIKNGSPPNIRRYVLLVLPALFLLVSTYVSDTMVLFRRL